VKTPEAIFALYLERSRTLLDVHQGMQAVKDIYEGKATVPLPDMDKQEKSSVPNLLAQGVDQMAGRIASTMPIVSFSAGQTRRSERKAKTAERIVGGWWQNDRLPQKMKHRARHLVAYGMSPCVMRLDRRTKLPVWEVRNPLHTFPSSDYVPGTSYPNDVIFAYRRSINWLVAQGYELQVRSLFPNHHELPRDLKLLMLEYVCPEGTRLVLSTYAATSNEIGQWDANGNYIVSEGLGGDYRTNVILEDIPNPTDVPTVTLPERLGLERASGQFDSMIGMYYQQAKLMALEVMAVERGIFPDTYLVSRPGEIGRFVDGPYDGREGLVNIVTGGDIKELATQPGYMTPQTIDRIERAQRLTAGIPQEFGGESTSNIRTGRRGDAVLSAVIDFPVGEAQEILANALLDEDRAAIALSKHFAGRSEKTLYVGTGNSARTVTYRPNEVFDTIEHTVSYPAVGADLNNMIMGLGQRVGMGIMSKRTAATLDPFIDNAEVEHDEIIVEGLETAMLSGLQQQAASGQIPPMAVARIMELVQTDRMELPQAINKAVEEAQKAAEEAQRAAQEAQAAEQQPMPATPEMAAAGPTAASLSGNPEALSPVPGPEQGTEDIGGLLAALRGGM
jgi:hypothetical protein